MKKTLVTMIKIIISFGLIAFLFHKLGLKNVLSQLISVNIYWLLLGIVIFSLSNVLGAFQWHLLLKSKAISLPFYRVLYFYYTGLFFNNFLLGYVGGDAVRIYDITKSTGKNSDAVSSVFFDRFTGFVVSTSMALIAALYWMKLFSSGKILFSVFILFLYLVLMLVLFFNKRLIDKLSAVFKFFLPEKVKLKAKEIYMGINGYRHHKLVLLKVACISLLVQGMRIFVHYFAARAVGVRINPIYFIIFLPIIALLASIPISIGGIGVRESSGVALFSTIWKVQADIVAFEFLAYLIGIISTLPGGILFIFQKEHIKYME
ncbi:MAG: lysylphosphatidylglycerol synthase transmembrane domain-containing protein [candidate division KSB1 bacterium]|jgi:uncharacterized protein (TIRG00374 family)|nr:lysylphosphatidylglycerol synthase transmembrane domain-containing protein [candidate division KSB1 bacterium]